MEGLEARDVPAVVGLQPMTPVLTSGVLTVIGNDAANTIMVNKVGSNLTVLGKSYASSQVRQIAIDGQGGNDTITVSESITQKAFLYGGWGTDTIRGGGGSDEIYGGTWNDVIYGRKGNDSIYGGAGGDTVDGGLGDNAVLDSGSGDRVTNASTFLSEDSTLTGYSRSNYTGQVVYEVLRLVNAARANAGKRAVSLDAALNTVASDYAKLLDAYNVPIGQNISHAFSGHVRPLVGSRLAYNLVPYSTSGENNSYRLNTRGLTATRLAYEIMYGPDGRGGLMNSAGHRANILNGSFTRLGLGLSGSTATGYYMTQVFTG